jgi:glucose-1-phosphate adenylyltransferase
MATHPIEQSLDLPKRAIALVLAGGRGSRLMQLTDRRAKPAVYFGGKFRIIDFALSNCLNSGVRRIGVITQYKSHSLLRHLQRGWAFLKTEMNEFVDLLPAQQRMDEEQWYRARPTLCRRTRTSWTVTTPSTWWFWAVTTSTR